MVDERYVREELAKAHEALADAETLLDGGGSTEGIVNRLYYAAFHAAQAILYARDIEPASHGGVRNRFGEELVLGGPAARDQGRLLTTLADLRQQADYGHGPISADVGELHERTRAFVDAMADLVADS
jgi:uncharacterized protein (UPF0332 family)